MSYPEPADLVGQGLNPVAGPHFNFTIPESMGVVGVVVPARPALLGLLGAVLPIITSGNTVVVIASEADSSSPPPRSHAKSIMTN